MFGIIKKMFIVLLASIVNDSNHMICVSLSNHKREIQTTLINLQLNEYSQELHYYTFAVKLDRCVKVVILLVTYQIKYAFQVKQKI